MSDTYVRPAGEQHGLTKFMDQPMLLAQPEDVVPRALSEMTPAEQQHFTAVAADLQAAHPTKSSIEVAHMALAAMIMEYAEAFVAKRGIGNLTEANVMALEWARKVHKQNFQDPLKESPAKQDGPSWMSEVEEFQITQRKADGTETTVRAKMRVADVLNAAKVIDIPVQK